jgi:hypothetical protein
LPNRLEYLNCSYNQLISLPELPDRLDRFDCSYNPDLRCLPQLKRYLHTIQVDSTGITCLPNHPSNHYYVSPANLALCNFFNDNNCPVFYDITGNVYVDADSSCLHGNTEATYSNATISLLRNGVIEQQTVSSSTGYYSFYADTGTYEITLDTSGLPFFDFCPASATYLITLTPNDTMEQGLDFGFRCKPGPDLAAWSIEGRFRPGNVSKADVHVGSASSFYGINCSDGISGNVTVVISGPVTYASPASGALIPDNVIGNTLTYNVADFGTVDFNNSFNIMVLTDTTAALGSTVCFTVTVTAVNVDAVPANNTLTHCFTVVGSFDPNDKQVYPTADIDTSQEWLTYTIRFQNTGTAEAQHIYITDTLDSDIDESSFQLLAYSHQPMVQLKENAVRFNFPNINLPDSNTNEPLSHGYVQYKVKLKDNLRIGTQINNTAFIYFDFNAPVVTNTTSNTIAVISSLPSNSLKGEPLRLYPNPANDVVTISIDESMIGSTATVSDIMGRKMAALPLTTYNSTLSTSQLASGVYLVTAPDKIGRSIARKLVVSH